MGGRASLLGYRVSTCLLGRKDMPSARSALESRAQSARMRRARSAACAKGARGARARAAGARSARARTARARAKGLVYRRGPVYRGKESDKGLVYRVRPKGRFKKKTMYPTQPGSNQIKSSQIKRGMQRCQGGLIWFRVTETTPSI